VGLGLGGGRAVEVEEQKEEEPRRDWISHAFEFWSHLYSVSNEHPVSGGLEIYCVRSCCVRHCVRADHIRS
jgi:hypothetical protein